MRRIIHPVFFLLLAVPLFGLQWSRNNVLEFTAANLTNFANIADYNAIDIMPEYLAAAADTNSWLMTYAIDAGDNYVFSEAFIDFESDSSNGSMVIRLRNYDDDALLMEESFTRSGKMDLSTIFNKKVYLNVEAIGGNIRILSYGLARKPEVVITSNDIIVLPELLFFGESGLNIDFFLHFPALLDIILFDPDGNIIDYITKSRFFHEGQNTFNWDISGSRSAFLNPGIWCFILRFALWTAK